MAVSLACVLLGGCKAVDEIKSAFIFACCLIAFVLVVYLLGSWAERSDATHKKRLREAPRKYTDAADQLRAWMPECRFILLEESRSGNAYAEGSDCCRARDKSIAILNAALEHI